MRTPTHLRYDLVTVEDFAQLSEDQLDVCLDEFKEFIKAYIECKKTVLPKIELNLDKFVWIDDGDTNCIPEYKTV